MMKKNEKLRNFDLSIEREGQVEFYVPATHELHVPSKSMAVFYNKKMEINRDISNLAILAYSRLYNQKPLVIVDSMASSGVSSIRMIKECKNIEKIYIHGINPTEVEQACSGIHMMFQGKFGRYILFGQAQSGKYIKVILENCGKAQYRPITAYEMTAKEKQKYRRKIR